MCKQQLTAKLFLVSLQRKRLGGVANYSHLTSRLQRGPDVTEILTASERINNYEISIGTNETRKYRTSLLGFANCKNLFISSSAFQFPSLISFSDTTVLRDGRESMFCLKKRQQNNDSYKAANGFKWRLS